MKKLTLYILFFTTSFHCLSQSWTDTLRSALLEAEKNSTFDGQVLISQKGKIVFHQAFGHSADGKEIDLASTCQVFSITKPITAVAIMQLQEAGKLQINDPVKSHLLNFPYPKITIRHLLNQTSDLPRLFEIALKYADTSKVISNPEIIGLLKTYRPHIGSPNEHFRYNNANFILLGSIIESASGKKYSEYIQDNILTPSGMIHTRDLLADTVALAQVNADNFFQPYGSGNLASNAIDLFLFNQAISNNVLLSAKSQQLLFEKPELSNGERGGYGLGWFVEESKNGKTVSHVGDGSNIKITMKRFLDNETVIIIAHQNSAFYGKKIYHMIQNIYDKEPFEQPIAKEVFPIDVKLYKNYVGKYLSGFGLVHITQENGRLYLRPDPVPGREELIPSSATTFYFKNQDLEWEFFLDESGNVIGFGIKGSPEMMGKPQK